MMKMNVIAYNKHISSKRIIMNLACLEEEKYTLTLLMRVPNKMKQKYVHMIAFSIRYGLPWSNKNGLLLYL